MFSKTIGLLATALLYTTASAITETHSQQFPVGSEVENLALRPGGSAIVVINTHPELYEVQQPVANATPKVIHTFPNVLGASSITPSGLEDDVFFVVTGNLSFSQAGLEPEPNSYSIHRLSFDKDDNAVVKELGHLDAVKQPNGIINVPHTPYVLIADCYAGFVFRFNTETAELTTYWDDPLLKPTPPTVPKTLFGVNGLKFSNGYLYFSNTNQKFVGRVKATGTESCVEAKAEKVVTQVPVDDILIDDRSGDVYMALQWPVPAQQGFGVWRSGSSNSSAVEMLYTAEGPTAAAWRKGAEGRTLVATATGDFFFTLGFNSTQHGQIDALHLDK